MSTPPKAFATSVEGGAHRSSASVTSQAKRQRGAADALRHVPTRQRRRGRAPPPRRRRAPVPCAVAAPMPRPPPVTSATWRASGFSAALPSLACSSDQYSMSNRSASPSGSKRPIASASVIDCDGVLGDVGGDGRVLRGSAQPEQPQPGHQHHARQRIELGLLRLARGHCCGRNRPGSGRRSASTAATTASRQSCQSARMRRRHDKRPGSWCGWCGRASPRPLANSVRAPRR